MKLGDQSATVDAALALHELSESRVIDQAIYSAADVYAALPVGAGRAQVMFYDGTRWTPDTFDTLYNHFLPAIIHDTQGAIAAGLASKKFDGQTAKIAEAFSRQLDSLTSRKRIDEGLRRSLVDLGAGFADGHARADEALWLFNTRSGTIDLRTLELRAHSPSDYITQLAPVDYDPAAIAPNFERVIARILPDPDVRAYVQELLGYALNGHIRAAILPVFYGLGANGKSTLLNAVRAVLGSDYAATAAGRMLEAQGTSQRHPTERMIFKGRRLVLASETGEGMKLDETSVKEYTSSEPISARALYRDFEDFRPTHTLIMHTNHVPKVAGSDEGIWRRLREVPFKVAIPEPERDPGLATTLEAESSGILNWLLAGHKRWYARGQRFAEPKAVADATDAYRIESNPIEVFVRDTFNLGPDEWCASVTLYDKYKTWADREGFTHKLTQPQLTSKLRRLYNLTSKIRRVNSAVVRGWTGIGLKGDPPPTQPTEPSTDPSPNDESEAPMHDAEVDALMQRTPKGRDDALALARVEVGDIYVDVETTGLHPTEDRVRLLTVSDGTHHVTTFDMYDDGQRAAGITWLAAHRHHTFVAHFAQFDLAMLEGNFGYVHRGPVFCTNVASKIKHAGVRPPVAPKVIVGYTKAGKPKYSKADTPHSLRSVVHRELNGRLLDKSDQRSDWSVDALTDAQLEYAKADVEVLPAVAASLREAVDSIGTTWLDMANVKIAAHMAVRGVRFDVNAWLKLAKPHVEAIERIDAELDRVAAEAFGPGAGRFNANSVPQKLALLKARGIDAPNTKADTIKAYAGTHLVARLLTERAEHMKLATTYGEGFLQHVDKSSRIRSTYGVYGAATGRFSSSEPNLQNIPREAEYRACFLPDEGTKFVIADWSQIEVRYIAAISEDMALREALATGDVYEATARKLLHSYNPDDYHADGSRIDEIVVTKEQRQLAKAIVLGFQYGMGVDKFRRYALDTFGVALSTAEAREYRDAFFRSYPRLRAWQRETGQPTDPDAYSAPNRTNSFTHMGRVRRDIDQYTERINTPIQSAGADALKLALVELYNDGHDIVLHVHDEIVLQASEADAEVVARQLQDVMESAALVAIDPDYAVPVPAEVAIGDSWAAK